MLWRRMLDWVEAQYLAGNSHGDHLCQEQIAFSLLSILEAGGLGLRFLARLNLHRYIQSEARRCNVQRGKFNQA